MKCFFALTVALSLVSFDALAQSVPVPSTWKNQRNSVLTISSIDASGKLTGTYVNNAPGTLCLTTPYGAAGRVSGKTVRFWVNFTGAGCFTVSEWSAEACKRFNAVDAVPSRLPRSKRQASNLERIGCLR